MIRLLPRRSANGMEVMNALAEGVLFEKVLVIEDEVAHALLIERALRGAVAHVRRVERISDGCELLAKEQFDLVISDLHLPDVGELGPVATLRQQSKFIPLIVLTSSSTVSDGVAAMRAGANDFLVKSFDENFKDVLLLAVSRVYTAWAIKRDREELARDRDILRQAVENSDDGLAVVESCGRVRHCNSAFNCFLKDFGASLEDVTTLDRTKMENGEAILQSLKEKLSELQSGAVWTTEALSKRGNGEAAYDISLSRSVGADQIRPSVLWVKDIRERKRREKFQREILSTTTHDLKGPLGAISLSCEVLLDKELEDRRTKEVLLRISTSANSAIHLIEEFLSARRIEEGTFLLRPVLQEVVPILERCVETYTIPYQTRKIALSLQYDEQDLLGCIDALGLERVLSNLLSNGIKFTPAGGSVLVRSRRSESGVLLSVSDTGAGMEPSEAQTLFDKYSRLSKHAGVPGSGLGLFIVKSVVSAHGGSINVTSAVGQGTTFDISFPDAPPINERGEVVCLTL